MGVLWQEKSVGRMMAKAWAQGVLVFSPLGDRVGPSSGPVGRGWSGGTDRDSSAVLGTCLGSRMIASY